MESEGSLPCSQKPVTGLYPEPDESNPHLTLFPFPSVPRSSEWSFRSGFPTKILYAFLIHRLRTTPPAQRVLLDLITIIILGEEYGYKL
jgi:hypothetical protein